MSYKNLLILFIWFNSISGLTQNAGESLNIENFDSNSFGEWIKEGTAFGYEPAGEEDEHYMIGFLGRGFATSENAGNEPATGTLTSPEFMIKRNTIHFLIGGHEIHFMQGTTEGWEKLRIQLLADGKVVRSNFPDEYHAMFWRGWDVSEFIGRKVRIRIVDNDDREGAHIDVDEIMQNDLPVDGHLTKRRIRITESKLNLPVNEKYPRYYLELWIDGKQVRAMDVALAPEAVDYWVVTDLSPWQGKEMEIRTRQYGRYNPEILDRITFADGILESKNLYEEELRQQFHFSSKRGWLNDPNGLVYYDGEYHLFYQHNPYGWDHSRNDYNKTWGHAVSTDLVHWQELPGAIHPDHLGPIYSGSAVVDYQNTTGFQTGEEAPIVCVYTSAGGRSPWSVDKKFTQSLAYSNDRGRTFTIYDKNPVQKNLDYINRDPKAIWHQPTKQWVIVLHFDERAMAFFTSDDLKTWEYQSEVESDILVDCPELFQLPVDGDKEKMKWILYGGSAHYMLGDFDGRKFTPETDELRFDYGNCFYASQTFNNAPDGRRVQIAWATIETPGMPFNMSMLFPVELSLHATGDKIRMFAWPVPEIENIYGRKYSWNDLDLLPGQDLLRQVQGELFDIEAEFVSRGSQIFGITVNGITVSYNSKNHILSCGEEQVSLKPREGHISLRLLVDRLSLELFANKGEMYMPVRKERLKGNKGLSVFSKGGKTTIRSLEVRELKSIW